MADITKFYTRVQLKYDTWANWNTDTAKANIPLKGEVCLVEVPGTGTSDLGHKNATSVTKPAVLMKVGDGVTTFGELPWLSALAADVHSWAKQSSADFITWLDETAKFATDDELETVSSAVEVLSTKVSGIDSRLETAESNISGLQQVDSDHGERLTALETAVGTNGEGDSFATRVTTLESEMDTAQSDIDKLEAAMEIVNGGESVSGSIAKALKDAKDYSDSQDEAQTKALQEYADKAETDAIASAKTYTDGQVSTLKTNYEAADSAINEKLNTLIGTDSGKSARTIANEELAAQLLSGEADADFKTLQELAAWLEDHPEDAAAMSADILALTKEVYGSDATDASGFTGDSRIDKLETNLANEVSARENAITGVQNQIDALKGTGEGSVSDQISDAVATAKTQWEAYADQAEADAESAAATYTDEKVDNEKSRAEGIEAKLQTQIKTLVGSEDGTLVAGSVVAAAIATAKQGAIDAAASDATSKANTALADAKTYTNTRETAITQAYTAVTDGLDNRLDVIEGDENTAGSIKKAVADEAKLRAEADTALGNRITANENKLAGISEATVAAHVAAAVKAETDNRVAADNVINGRLDVIEGTGEGSIKKAVADEKSRAEEAEQALANRAEALEDKVGTSGDAASASGTLYARVAQNAKDIDTVEGSLNAVAARPFVKVTENSKTQYVVFYCGTASEMVDNDITLVEP